MVEIIKFFGRGALALAALFVAVSSANAASTYEELVRESQVLSQREDSLSRLVATRRGEIATAGDAREVIGEQIKRLEMELFDLSREKSALLNRLSAMKQSVAASGAAAGGATGGATGVASTTSGAKQISSAAVLKSSLPKEDYTKLITAERAEAECGTLFVEYMRSYNRLRELKQLYDQAKDESKAIEYSDEFHKLESSIGAVGALLSSRWSEIYDSKNYAYSMALELLSDEKLMSSQTELAYEAAGKISEVEHSDDGEAALNYDYQKRAQSNFELLLAERLGLPEAVDSLRGVVAAQAKRAAVEDLSEVVFKKRNFILYEPIRFVTTTPYNAKNPIPTAVEYKRGEIYRIQFGAYKYEQLPTIFRGVVPMSKDRALGFWTYYGGGYATLAEAEAAVALCKRRGFKRPEVVRWRDGVRRNLYREPEAKSEGRFRVHITGAATLPDMVRTAVRSGAAGGELTKVGADKYIVGTVLDRAAADRLVESLKVADETLMYSVVAVE